MLTPVRLPVVRSASSLAGSQISVRKARLMLPILVALAERGEVIFYRDLALLLGWTHARPVLHALRKIRTALDLWSEERSAHLPPLQRLVVSRQTGRSGCGDASAQETALERIYAYEKWNEVLSAFDLAPLDPHSETAQRLNQTRAEGGVRLAAARPGR